MADVTEIIDYYTNLLIIQYNNKEKARATISALIDASLASGIFFDIRDGYSVETAIGVQLDILGKYAGIDRFYIGQDLNGYFAFTDYDEVTPDAGKRGFSDYTDFETKEGKFLVYSSVLSTTYALNDDDFRILLKLRIVQNNIDHSHASIDDNLYRLFGDAVMADSDGNMVMDYFVYENFFQIILVAKQKEALPKPMGVRLRYLVEQTSPFFGFCTYDSPTIETIAGFTDYDDYDTKNGEFLTYSKLLA